MATIQRRGYVTRQGKALVPSFTAFAVTRLLREHFGDYVDLGFTAEMEEILDQISNGEKDWLDFIREFYRGDGKHHGLETSRRGQGAGDRLSGHRHLATIPRSGLPMRVRIGRYGPFLQLGDAATKGRARRCPRIWRRPISRSRRRWRCSRPRPRARESLGEDPATGQQVYVMHGRFGPYVQLGETPDGQEGREAAARVARPQTSARTRSRSTRRCGCCRCRASSAPPTTAR